MNHIKPYKIFELVETSPKLTFVNYYDKMSAEDRIKMDRLLDRGYKTWSDDDKEFMKRMAKKDVPLFIGSDRKTYTKKEVEAMGYDVDNLSAKKAPELLAGITELLSKYRDITRLSKHLTEKFNEEYDFTKIVKPTTEVIESATNSLSRFK